MYKTLHLSWGTGHERYLALFTNTISNNNNNDIRIFLFGILNKKDVECFRCNIFGMWDTQDVRCTIMLDVRDVERLVCGLFGMLYVEYLE